MGYVFAIKHQGLFLCIPSQSQSEHVKSSQVNSVRFNVYIQSKLL